MRRRVVASAPATIANLGPGFDVAALAIEGFRDRVIVEAERGEGVSAGPYGPPAEAAVRAVLRHAGVRGVRISIAVEKGVPVGAGLGSSGATAAAAVLAVNEALGLGFRREELVKFAAEGEAAVAGAPHADNVSASLLGGLVLAIDAANDKILKFEVPPEVRVVVLLVEPQDAREKTRRAREALPKEVPLAKCVKWLSSAMELAARAAMGDWRGFALSVRPDPVVEAAREPLYPHLPAVRRAALEAGALGCALAGAGPSVFALALERAEDVAMAMDRAAASAGVSARAFVTRVDNAGARIEHARG